MLVDVLCEGPLGRSHDSDRFPPARSGGFDEDRPRERGLGSSRSDREADDSRSR